MLDIAELSILLEFNAFIANIDFISPYVYSVFTSKLYSRSHCFINKRRSDITLKTEHMFDPMRV